MQFVIVTSVLAALTSINTLVSAHPVVTPRADGLILNGRAEWTVVLSKGTVVTLYGTAQEVTAQFKELDPAWVPQVARSASPKLSSRTWDGHPLCCPVPGQPWQPQNYQDVLAAQQEIVNFGTVVLSPGCSLVAEHDPAGIIVCVDAAQPLNVSLEAVWDYAGDIFGDCQGQFGGDLQCGQQFDTDGFNVIITNAH